MFCDSTPEGVWRLLIAFLFSHRKNRLAAISRSTDQGDFISRIWFEVALSRLLQLIDVPFLEDILTQTFTDDNDGVIVISNSVPIPSIQRSQQIDCHKENTDNS